MDRQSMQQLQGGGVGSSAAKQDHRLYPVAGGGGQLAPQIVDGTFIMELLEEDAPATEKEQPQEDVDRLSRVIQSLEAEIDGRPPPANAESNKQAVCDLDAGLLDDMLPDLDSSPGPCVADEALPPFEYWPSDVPPAVAHDMGGWYLDDDGAMARGYEFTREQCYYGYGESLTADQVYSPLWE